MKEIFASLLITVFIAASALAGEYRTLDPYAQETVNAVQEILIGSGKCIDKNDCTRQQYVFFNPIPKGIDLSFYGITEKELVEKLFIVLAREYYRLPAGSSLHARFVSSTKKNDLKRSSFKSAPVFAEIYMQDQQ